MKNIWDIKVDENYNYILTRDKKDVNYRIKSKVAVVIHLYYIDTIDFYMKYIKNIPDEIDIIFTVSEEKIRNMLENVLGRNVYFCHKNNRGRDISAFLVAAREMILHYKYICFLHDKKEKDIYVKEDTDIFIKCLWENMIGSKGYIYNIIQLFEKDDKLGVLLPPESVSDNYTFIVKDTWDNDFDLMVDFAHKMNLNCNLDRDKKPLSLGTVFWARVSALKKLLEIDWKYTDFMEEPLPCDGTLSHVIERCFGYIAQDAGYSTGIVMSDDFAGRRMDKMQEMLLLAFKVLKHNYGLITYADLKRATKFLDIDEFINSYQNLYIYGAGILGQRCAKLLGNKINRVKGFVVSKKKDCNTCMGIPVFEITEVDLISDTGIIIAVSKKYLNEVVAAINENDCLFNNFYFFS